MSGFGKWEYIKSMAPIGGDYIVVDEDRYPIAEIQGKANALLISKAPEMLEMLEKISQFIDENENINYKIRLLSMEVPEIKILIKSATEL